MSFHLFWSIRLTSVAGIRAAVLGLVGVGGQVAEHGLEAAALEVDVPRDIVVVQAVAGQILLADMIGRAGQPAQAGDIPVQAGN